MRITDNTRQTAVNIKTAAEKESKKNSMDWYRVIAYSGIPLFGLLYLLLLSRRNKNPAIREYAGAAFKYRLTMFGIAVITLTAAFLILLPHFERFLDYLELL